MDEIIKSLDNIADAINGNALTTCLSIIFAVVPIVLTIVTIVLSVRIACPAYFHFQVIKKIT